MPSDLLKSYHALPTPAIMVVETSLNELVVPEDGAGMSEAAVDMVTIATVVESLYDEVVL